MKISKEQIEDIASTIHTGMIAYINPETYEIKYIIDADPFMTDMEVWEEDIQIVEEEWNEYISISQMDSYEAYRVMEEFAHQLEDENLQRDLFKILNRKSPFANFKDEIDYSDERQKWFDFRQKKHEEYVKSILMSEGIEYEG